MHVTILKLQCTVNMAAKTLTLAALKCLAGCRFSNPVLDEEKII